MLFFSGSLRICKHHLFYLYMTAGRRTFDNFSHVSVVNPHQVFVRKDIPHVYSCSLIALFSEMINSAHAEFQSAYIVYLFYRQRYLLI